MAQVILVQYPHRNMQVGKHMQEKEHVIYIQHLQRNIQGEEQGGSVWHRQRNIQQEKQGSLVQFRKINLVANTHEIIVDSYSSQGYSMEYNPHSKVQEIYHGQVNIRQGKKKAFRLAQVFMKSIVVFYEGTYVDSFSNFLEILYHIITRCCLFSQK